MNSPARLLILLLGLTALGCAFFAYRERSRQAATAETMVALEKERDLLLQRIQTMEKAARPQMNPSSLGPIPDFTSKGPQPFPQPFPQPLPQPGNLNSRPMVDLRTEGGLGGGTTTSVLENPELKKLVGLQQRAALDARFAALFRELKLSPSNLEKFKQLLVDKQTAFLDVRTAAQTQSMAGKDAREVLRERVTKAQTDADNAIRSTLGDAGFKKYQTYEETLPERDTINQLEQRLSYSSSPLSNDQMEKLITLMAEHSTSPGSANAATAPAAALRSINSPMAVAAPIAAAVITRSESFLNSEQLAAFRQIQQEQEARAQLSQQFRAGPGMMRPPGGPPSPTVTPLPHP